MDPNKRIEDLLFITSELVDLLGKENAALKNNQLDTVQGLLERKTALSRAYEVRIFGMKQEQGQVEYTESDLANIDRLEEVGQQVADLIIQNEHMLKVALEVSRRFMDCIADSVKQRSLGAGAYSADGIIGATSSAAKKQAASIALDEIL